VEFASIRHCLELGDEVELGGRLISSRSHDGMTIMAVRAGPGKIRSASATQLVIDHYKPDMIFDVGGAGALDPNVKIKDIIIAENAFEYDICDVEDFPRLADDLTSRTVICDLLKEGKNVFEEFISRMRKESSIECKIGNIVSGERNVNERVMREKLHGAFQAAACNWETSAILKTAQLNEVKSLSFRVITDSAGEKMSEEFRENEKEAMATLYSVLKEFIIEGWLLRIMLFMKNSQSVR
jgi:adenosylhomocysteine nucleosidase